MKESINNWAPRLHRRTKNRASQLGVTLQEVLIGIAVAAVLAAASIFLGARFIGQGQFASARQSLQTAVLATESVYATIVPGGGRNYTGATLPADAAAAEPAVSATLSSTAVTKLNSLGEDLNFVPYVNNNQDNCNTSAKDVCVADNRANSAAQINELGEKDVWVQVLDMNTAGGLPGSGQAIRLGMRASNGATLCVIVVKQASSTDDLGHGYQAVDQSTSTDSTTPNPADCGMSTNLSSAHAATTHLPGGTGVDASLADPAGTAYAD